MRLSLDSLQTSLEQKSTEKHKAVSEILLDLQHSVDARGTTPSMPCGIKELDDLICGLHRRELLVLASRPSNGKTSLSLQICFNLAKLNIPTIFASLEMSRENIVERLMCQEFGISGWKLRKGDPLEKEKFFSFLPKMYELMKSMPLQIIDYFGRTIEEIEYMLTTYKPQALFVDHIQKISTMNHGSKYEALSHYINTIQDLAISYDCAIVVNSQINRGGDFAKGSGDIEECCDCFLATSWKAKENPDYFDKTEYEINVTKQRHGACDYRVISFNADTFSFKSRET